MSREENVVRQGRGRRAGTGKNTSATDQASPAPRTDAERDSAYSYSPMASTSGELDAISTDGVNAAGFVGFLDDVWDEDCSETVDDYDIDELFDEFPETQERPTTLVLGEFSFDNTLVEDDDMGEFED